MLCQNCNAKQASTHIKHILNGQLSELHLCSACARDMGYGNGFSPFELGTFLGGAFGEHEPVSQILRCPQCGCSYDEIADRGKIGCAECYHTFIAQLLPMIKRIHGASQHKGKRPGGSALLVQEKTKPLVPVQESEIQQKRRMLQQAINEQNFEFAAKLRDEIKEMENHG